MVPAFPQEMADQVIDHLWDDPKALEACSLSCRSWLPSSRTHLHRTIRVHDGEHFARFQQLLKCVPVIACYVRQLAIGGRTVPADAHRTVRTDTWLSEVAPLLEKFERLEELQLTRLHWNAFQGSPLYASLARIKRLVIVDARFHEWADVRDLLSAMSSLQELTFHRVCWDIPTRHARESIPLGNVIPSLRSLVLDSGPPHDSILHTLLASNDELGLRNLSLRWCYRNDTKALGDLLRASGASLERLHLELPNGLVEEAVSRHEIDLVANSALRYVHFDGLHLPGYCAWVPILLSQVPSERLETVEMSIMSRRVEDLASFDWERLNAVFAQRRFFGVKLVLNINYAIGMAYGTDAMKTLMAYMPDLAMRATISVVSL